MSGLVNGLVRPGVEDDIVGDVVEEMRGFPDWDMRAIPSEGSDFFDERTTSDPTYLHLGTELIPHTRFPDMFLLEYQTFSGQMAYQPCSKGIDIQGFFKALEPVERGGDNLFKIARSWSCIVQSIQGLPKDIRWVLATIYDFANEMMRPGTGEDALWAMRQWLIYWFDTAEKLFQKYDYPIFAPAVDWFSRPTAMTVDDDDDQAADLDLGDCTFFRQGSISSDGNRTVIHHRSVPTPIKFDAYRREANYLPGINAWMAGQPDWAGNFGQPFDPTPEGRILSRSEPMLPSWLRASARKSDRQEGGSNVFRFNPDATEFMPQMEQTTSSASTTSRSPSPMSEGSAGGYGTTSESDGLSGDERSLSSAEHLLFMIEAHGGDGEDVEMWG
ncbi:hypothetical protein E4U54_007353 [Claviceps lovelessii]|nr:hypothetical protein E4U54_007353 [Claviceps lovelessii]